MTKQFYQKKCEETISSDYNIPDFQKDNFNFDFQ